MRASVVLATLLPLIAPSGASLLNHTSYVPHVPTPDDPIIRDYCQYLFDTRYYYTWYLELECEGFMWDMLRGLNNVCTLIHNANLEWEMPIEHYCCCHAGEMWHGPLAGTSHKCVHRDRKLLTYYCNWYRGAMNYDEAWVPPITNDGGNRSGNIDIMPNRSELCEAGVATCDKNWGPVLEVPQGTVQGCIQQKNGTILCGTSLAPNGTEDWAMGDVPTYSEPPMPDPTFEWEPNKDRNKTR